MALAATALAIRRARRRRLATISQRSDLPVHDLARDIAGNQFDCGRVEHEIICLAKALRVSAGKLRPDDVVVDILGSSHFAGDDLLEIEARLQKQFPSVAQRRLTMKELIGYLAQSPR